jgi:hypothetical protein
MKDEESSSIHTLKDRKMELVCEKSIGQSFLYEDGILIIVEPRKVVDYYFFNNST